MNASMAPPSTTSLISAVVAPAILILACSSLITTTANRLSMLLRRVRDLAHEMEVLQAARSETPPAKRVYVAALLTQGTARVKLLQRTLATLYLALACLVFASVCIGLSAWIGIRADLIAAGALLSVAFLFYGSTLLIRESRVALKAVNAEMEYIRGLVENTKESSHAG